MTTRTTLQASRPVSRHVLALPVEQDRLGLSDEAAYAFWQRWSSWKGASAENSIRSMTTGMKRFVTYCRAAGQQVLPATPPTLVGFVRALEAEGLKPASIANRLSAVALLHDLAGLASPTKDKLVQLETKRVRKERGTAQRQSAALRARGEIEAEALDDPREANPTGLCVATLCAAAGEAATELEGSGRPSDRRRRLVLLRDAAMLSLAYDGGLRSEEVVRVRREDLTFDKRGRGVLTIRRSKTDQEGEGAEVPVSPASAFLLGVWYHAAATEGHAEDLERPFVRVTSSGFVSPGSLLRPVAVTDSFRRLAALTLTRMKGGAPLTEEERETVRRFSGHAARIGAAQDALALGEELAAIMQSFRWQSPRMAMRYTRQLRAMAGAAARTQEALR